MPKRGGWPREDEEKHHRNAVVTLRFGTYHISSIRRRGYYNFSAVQGRRLLEGGGNKLQVPVGHSYFGKGSLCYNRLSYKRACPPGSIWSCSDYLEGSV